MDDVEALLECARGGHHERKAKNLGRVDGAMPFLTFATSMDRYITGVEMNNDGGGGGYVSVETIESTNSRGECAGALTSDAPDTSTTMEICVARETTLSPTAAGQNIADICSTIIHGVKDGSMIVQGKVSASKSCKQVSCTSNARKSSWLPSTINEYMQRNSVFLRTALNLLNAIRRLLSQLSNMTGSTVAA